MLCCYSDGHGSTAGRRLRVVLGEPDGRRDVDPGRRGARALAVAHDRRHLRAALARHAARRGHRYQLVYHRLTT